MEGNIEKKLKNLKEILKKMGTVLVAFSGGVDSTFLLRVAKDVLGEKVIAVTALSPTYPREEVEEAKKISKKMGVRHILIETRELEDSNFVNNPPTRCYYCKRELFSALKKIAEENNLRWVADGSNLDDTGDFRPGMQAARELGVRSPLKEAHLGKSDIRELSKKLGLSTWNKPSLACLASRFPYGMRIKKEELLKVEEAERFLRKMGISQIRVRHYGDTARIEVREDEIPKLFENKKRNKVIEKFKQLGYTYITVDLEGYRTGSMNEVLKKSD